MHLVLKWASSLFYPNLVKPLYHQLKQFYRESVDIGQNEDVYNKAQPGITVSSGNLLRLAETLPY